MLIDIKLLQVNLLMSFLSEKNLAGKHMAEVRLMALEKCVLQ